MTTKLNRIDWCNLHANRWKKNRFNNCNFYENRYQLAEIGTDGWRLNKSMFKSLTSFIFREILGKSGNIQLGSISPTLLRKMCLHLIIIICHNHFVSPTRRLLQLYRYTLLNFTFNFYSAYFTLPLSNKNVPCRHIHHSSLYSKTATAATRLNNAALCNVTKTYCHKSWELNVGEIDHSCGSYHRKISFTKLNY